MMPPLGPELQAIVDGLASHSPREAAIVAHGLIESALEAAVRSSCIQHVDSRLFKSGGILASYFGLYTIGHAFGIIPDELRNELFRIGEIRNAFAHSVIDLSFDSADKDIAKNCAALALPNIFRQVGNKLGFRMSEDDGAEIDGIYLVDATGAIGATALFEPEQMHINKFRFLASAKLAWIMLRLVSMNAEFVRDRRMASSSIRT